MLTEILINSIISGLLLSLVAIGFGIIFHTTKVFHLVHGAFYVYIPYIIWSLSQDGASIGNHFLLLFPALLLAIILVYAIEKLVYLPLHKNGSNQTISLISSLGAYIFLVNSLTFIFGNESITLNNESQIFLPDSVFRITSSELIQVAVSFIVLIAIFFLSKSGVYKRVRAVSDNPTVAKKFGISVVKSRVVALIIGTVLVSISGFLKSIDVAVDAHSGMGITLAAAVAVIIGGEMSIKGTLFVCFIITLIQNFSVLIIPSKWEESIVYILLMVVMIFFSRGLISNKLRVETR